MYPSFYFVVLVRILTLIVKSYFSDISCIISLVRSYFYNLQGDLYLLNGVIGLPIILLMLATENIRLK